METDKIKIEPKWSKSKEEVWNDQFADLEDEVQPTVSFRKRNAFLFYTSAAAIVIILILPVIGFLYTKDVAAPRGEHLSVALPDGSQVELNADSKLSYKPFWWYITRNAELSGEAFFEVTKGQSFTVQSAQASVRVLGTSFNVYARDKEYGVTCVTGKVEVSKLDQTILLTPNMRASFEGNKLVDQQIENTEDAFSWKENKFAFDAAPLIDVIAEIECQYNIRVEIPPNCDYIYTGNFTRMQQPEQVLEIIEKPFGIKLKIR